MDGYQRRTARKKQEILSTARSLFGRYGFKKVSLDEIARGAGVSKVTIYNYFQSKEGLIELLIAETFREKKEAIAGLIHSELSFPEKLRGLILQKTEASESFSREFLEQMAAYPIWKDQPTQETEKLMDEFFDQGRREGFISKKIPNSILLLYLDIFKAGTVAKADELGSLEKEGLGTLIAMFFRGFAGPS